MGIFTGVLAKEAVIGTLNAAYSALAASDSGAATADEEFHFGNAVTDAFATIPANLGEALGAWADPLGLGAADSGEAAVAEENHLGTGTFGAMQSRFDGSIGAFAYLLFILLYFPCTATVAVVYQEAGARWSAFVVLWTTGLAYCAATFYYQAATFARHPAQSTVWMALVGAVMIAAFFSLRLSSKRVDKEARTQTAASKGNAS